MSRSFAAINKRATSSSAPPTASKRTRQSRGQAAVQSLPLPSGGPIVDASVPVLGDVGSVGIPVSGVARFSPGVSVPPVVVSSSSEGLTPSRSSTAPAASSTEASFPSVSTTEVSRISVTTGSSSGLSSRGSPIGLSVADLSPGLFPQSSVPASSYAGLPPSQPPNSSGDRLHSYGNRRAAGRFDPFVYGANRGADEGRGGTSSSSSGSGTATSRSLSVPPVLGPVPISTGPSPDASLRLAAQTRFANGEHRGSFSDLSKFLTDCAPFVSAAQAKELAAILKDHETLAAFVARPSVSSDNSLPGKFLAQSAASSSPDFSAFSFYDFDGFERVTDTKHTGTRDATARDFNSEILRWRFWAPGRGFSSLTRSLTPFLFEPSMFRRFLCTQAQSSDSDRDELLRGAANADVWMSLKTLNRLQWFDAPEKVFFSLSSLNYGRVARDAFPVLSAGYFYSPGGQILDRVSAARQFLTDLRTPNFSAEGLIANFFECVTAVFLCPGLIAEFRSQNLAWIFIESSEAVSQPVILAQFFRCLAKLCTLLYTDTRIDDSVADADSPTMLSEIFRKRVDVPRWFTRQLAKSMGVTESSRTVMAREAAFAYFESIPGIPLPATSSTSSGAPVPNAPSPVSRPCVYGFLGKFRPKLGYTCKIASCSYSHDFGSDESAHVDAVRVVVESASSSSSLGINKEAVLASLSA
jgi:hypothetical protein